MGDGLGLWFSDISHGSESREGLVRPQMAGSHPWVSNSQDLEWDLRICISNLIPGEAAGGPKATF